MGTNFTIRVTDLGKQYHIGAIRTDTLYDRTSQLASKKQGRGNKTPTIWALRDINFAVRAGEVVGIIGRNGSGKSTLLKILARITSPTEGVAITYGRVAALLSVGTGFHPDLSGRDNIKLSGAILGMSRAEIAEIESAIIEFSEIEQFLDTPVKYYSSGMYSRLAFSVSVHLAAEIMLIDEVLAAGDAGFQLKSKERIRQAVSSGRTALFVSHSLTTIETLCDRVIVMDAGRMEFMGSPADAVRLYRHDILGFDK